MGCNGREMRKEDWNHHGGLMRKGCGNRKAMQKEIADLPETARVQSGLEKVCRMSRALAFLGVRLRLGLGPLPGFRLRLSQGMRDDEEGRYQLGPTCCVNSMMVVGICGAMILQKMIVRWMDR